MENISRIISLSFLSVKTWDICQYEYVHIRNLKQIFQLQSVRLTEHLVLLVVSCSGRVTVLSELK